MFSVDILLPESVYQYRFALVHVRGLHTNKGDSFSACFCVSNWDAKGESAKGVRYVKDITLQTSKPQM